MKICVGCGASCVRRRNEKPNEFERRKYCSRGCAWHRSRPIEVRFWAKVDKNGPTRPHMGSPCWVWTAGLHANGYGKFGRGTGSDVASRIAWELANGPIPEGLCALHRCDHRSCVRPDHLFLGTRLDNARDRVMKGRGRNGTTKLTREQVEHIRVIWSTGVVEMKAIGPAFGIHPAHVSGIIRNKFWKRSEAA